MGNLLEISWAWKDLRPPEASGWSTGPRSRREPGFVSISAGKDVVLGHVPLALADIYIAVPRSVGGLYLDLLGHFAAGVDLVALQVPKMVLKLHSLP